MLLLTSGLMMELPSSLTREEEGMIDELSISELTPIVEVRTGTFVDEVSKEVLSISVTVAVKSVSTEVDNWPFQRPIEGWS